VDTEPEARAYLKKFGITFPNGPDLGTRLSQLFRIQGVPETFIIDQEGVLSYVKVGPFTSLEEITSIVDGLIRE
jgi:cytochrome c biogenesis protein CcmG/thiol:disulfide interchange protein DsbE